MAFRVHVLSRVTGELGRLCGLGLLAGAALLLTNAGALGQAMGGPSLGGLGGGGAGGLGGGGLGGGGLGGGGLGGAGVGLGAGGLGGGGSTLAPSTALGPTVAIGGRGAVTSTTATTIPTASNPLRNYYNNLYQPGSVPPGSTSTLASFTSSSQGGFGQPLYGALTATVTTTSLTGGQPTTGGFTSIGQPKAPPYVTALSPDFVVPRRSPARLRRNLEAVLQRSRALQDAGNIQLVVTDSGVILRGQVKGARERRLAEALIRMTPGVQDVRNDLRVLTPVRRPSNY